ncbi:MAG: hypothetical protein ACXVQJ_09850, partial [Actinomycetota bacterium]
MATGKRGFGSIAACTTLGVGVVLLSHLGGGAHGTQGGYVAHPALRLSLLLLWGAAVGGAIGWLVRALTPRAKLPLGFGTLVAALGFVGGLAFAVHILGQDLLDGNRTVQLASSLAGAGVGWLIGACVGLALATGGPRPTLREAWRIRAIAIVPIVIGVAYAWESSPPARAAAHRVADSRAVQLAFLVDAAMVALPLLLAAGIRTRPADEPPEPEDLDPVARSVRALGIALGCTVLIGLIASAPQSRTSSQTFAQEHRNFRTLDSIQNAAQRYMQRMHALPADLDALRPYGVRLRHGTTVGFFGPVGQGLCVVVGAGPHGT